ncbi:hypothetical protein WICPIJ_004847 [Wickerhamomyces pijperi]|uniref:Uncharacterized protein n=1 Tax=Wickerhamomyces pijperi TaxID=599730 RepID=A0A9P8Q7A6_WICPI|nr:hypothetical protein WICPIJ_004847 [Wickerhamomyces pijperi]
MSLKLVGTISPDKDETNFDNMASACSKESSDSPSTSFSRSLRRLSLSTGSRYLTKDITMFLMRDSLDFKRSASKAVDFKDIPRVSHFARTKFNSLKIASFWK